MFGGVGWYIGCQAICHVLFVMFPALNTEVFLIILSFHFISSFPFSTFPYEKSLDPTAKFMSD